MPRDAARSVANPEGKRLLRAVVDQARQVDEEAFGALVVRSEIAACPSRPDPARYRPGRGRGASRARASGASSPPCVTSIGSRRGSTGFSSTPATPKPGVAGGHGQRRPARDGRPGLDRQLHGGPRPRSARSVPATAAGAARNLRLPPRPRDDSSPRSPIPSASHWDGEVPAVVCHRIDCGPRSRCRSPLLDTSTWHDHAARSRQPPCAYLADRIDVLPDRVADAVLDEAHRTRQRVVFGPRRTPVMNSTFKVILAAAAVLPWSSPGSAFCLETTPPWADRAQHLRQQVHRPARVPRLACCPPNSRESATMWLLAPTCGAGGATPADITFTVPAGWTSRYGIPNKDSGGPGEIAVGNWIIANVYTDPCQWQGSLLDPPSARPSTTWQPRWRPRRIATPQSQRMSCWAATRKASRVVDPSGPRPGHLRRRGDPDLGCAWRRHRPNTTAKLGIHPGQLNMVYIVDVNGERLVIDSWHMPGTSAADLAELDAILASMRIPP